MQSYYIYIFFNIIFLTWYNRADRDEPCRVSVRNRHVTCSTVERDQTAGIVCRFWNGFDWPLSFAPFLDLRNERLTGKRLVSPSHFFNNPTKKTLFGKVSSGTSRSRRSNFFWIFQRHANTTKITAKTLHSRTRSEMYIDSEHVRAMKFDERI